MRLGLPLVVPLVTMAACQQMAAPPPPTGPVAQLRAGFPSGGLTDTIEVDAVERLPLRAAVLLAPDGAATPANYINVAANPRFATGQWTTGNPWQNAVVGNAGIPALAPLDAHAAAALQSHEQVLATASTADIPLPDPVAYRRDWAEYRIRLTFGTPPGEVETRDIPAPQPPPEPPQRP